MPSNDTSIIEIIDLHPQEMELIKNLRSKWRFGEVTLVMRDGLPYRLRRIVEFSDLTNPSN